MMIENEILSHPIPKIIHESLPVIPIISQCDCGACASFFSAKNVTGNFDNLRYVSSALIRQSINSNRDQAVLSPKPIFTVLNESAINCLNYFSTFHYLKNIPSSWGKIWGEYVVQSTLKEMVELGLLIPEKYVAPKLNEFNIVLASWLHITDRCNLNCSYCYLPHNKVDMSIETGKRAIETTFHSAISQNYKQVKLKYSGGEPLLRFPFVAELHQYAQTLAEKHHLELDGVILSNGMLLTSEIIEEMKSLNLRLMISLDGLKECHDYHRHFPNGSGSFDKTSKAIDLAISCGLIPDISITISGQNVDGLPQLIEWVSERDLSFGLNFYRENDLSKKHKKLALFRLGGNPDLLPTMNFDHFL